jgi:heat shock protein HslJ
MKSHRWRNGALTAASLLLCSLGACASNPPLTAMLSPAAPALEGPVWLLTSLDGTAVTVTNDRVRPTLQFESQSKRAMGMAGVNRFTGGYTIEGSALKLGPLILTKMAGPPEQMEIEARFVRALEAVTQWRISGLELELLAGERGVARFTVKP